MSLINDALKRARQAQQKNSPPPVPGVPLRPVDVARMKNSGPGMLVPIAVAVVVLMAFGIGWVANRRDAGSRAAPVTNQETKQPPVAISPAAKFVPRSPEPVPEPTVAPIPSPAVSPPVALATPAPPPVTSAPPATATAPAAAPAVPPPAIVWPKLQGIVYRPDQPSALLNNKIVLIGGRSGEFLVVAIDRQSVTLECAGQTNVLRLRQ